MRPNKGSNPHNAERCMLPNLELYGKGRLGGWNSSADSLRCDSPSFRMPQTYATRAMAREVEKFTAQATPTGIR